MFQCYYYLIIVIVLNYYIYENQLFINHLLYIQNRFVFKLAQDKILNF